MAQVDKEYSSLVRDILDNGVLKNTRAGETISVFGKMLRFNLQEGLPILTTKKLYTKGVIHELLWFLSGSTNIKYLVENDVHIWDGDAYRFYLELVNKHNEILEERLHKGGYCISEEPRGILSKDAFIQEVKEEKWTRFYGTEDKYVCGDLGDVYGKQWRKFGETGRDQIANVIETLKNNPDDRRILCVAYNPDVLDKVALPPCHILMQFYAKPMSQAERLVWLDKHGNGVSDEWKWPTNEMLDSLNVPKRKLSCMWVQRSCDVGCGLPFNIASYAILTHMIAQCVNMEVDELVCSLGDAHIYTNHIEGLKEQQTRDKDLYKAPILELNPEIKNIDDFKFDDIKIVGYESHPPIKLELSVGL